MRCNFQCKHGASTSLEHTAVIRAGECVAERVEEVLVEETLSEAPSGRSLEGKLDGVDPDAISSTVVQSHLWKIFIN